MTCLLDDKYAPITSSIGFLRLGLDEARDALASWRRSLSPKVEVKAFDEGFPEVLCRLEPLTAAARPRELLVEASDGWTAYFDCFLDGTDAVSAIGFLAEEVGCQGLAITCVPHTPEASGRPPRYGSVQFELFGAEKTEFLNYVRAVAAAYDGDHWEFVASGEVQPFEETDAYGARLIKDRFTPEMLERYCRAMGLEVFDPDAYGPRAILVESQVAMPPNAPVMSLADAQRRFGISPG